MHAGPSVRNSSASAVVQGVRAGRRDVLSAGKPYGGPGVRAGRRDVLSAGKHYGGPGSMYRKM
jgi:hypothetical protein